MKTTWITLVLFLGAVAAGCGSGGGSSGSATTSAGVSPTGSSGRDPLGYDWSAQPLAQSAPGDFVGAIAASGSSSWLAAHASQRTVERVSAGASATEGGFAADVVGFAQDGALAATADPLQADAGDVYEHGPAGWSLALDGTRGAAVVAATTSQVFAFLGDATGGNAEVHQRDTSGSWSQTGSLPSSGQPTAAALHDGQLYVGVGPEAGLFRGDGGSFALLPAAFAKVSGASQRVSALLSTPKGLAVAVAATGPAGQPMGGEVLYWVGAGVMPVATFTQDAPLALAWQDGTLYVGTAAGRLVFVDSLGGLMDEPGLPANLGVHALASPDAATLLVGVAGQAGAELLVRTARSGGAGSGTVGAGGPDYLNDVKPILQARCVACHASMPTNYTLSTGLSDDAADHAATVAQVDPNAPDASRLLRKATNADAHAGGATLTSGSPEYGTLLAWIQAGAPLSGGSAGSGGAPPAGTPAAPPAAGTPDYLRWAKPVLLARCAGCHAPMNTPYRVSTGMTDDQGDYTATRAQVDLAAPDMSRLLRKATNTDAHGGGPTLQAGGAEYNQLLAWIQGGAQFMTAGGAAPPPPMVPANPTYLVDIKPILGSCVGCHVSEDDFRLSANLADDQRDYRTTLGETNLTTPANSGFLRRATRQSGHPVKVFDVGSIPYETFLKWAQQGAKFQ